MIQILILVVAVTILLLMLWQVLRVNQLDKNAVILQQLAILRIEHAVTA
ncbi:MAG: hypothetical protein V4440_04375 [Pseudomonadota bacterium]